MLVIFLCSQSHKAKAINMLNVGCTKETSWIKWYSGYCWTLSITELSRRKICTTCNKKITCQVSKLSKGI